jgi:hypothetical protein
MSLAMVEAAVESSHSRRRTLLADTLQSAWETAVRDEVRETVRARLAAWPTILDAVGLR